MKKLGGKIFLSMLLVAAFLTSGVKSWADTDLQFAKFLQYVKWSGDYRLRFDNEHFRNPSLTEDRARWRMRLRLGTDFGFPGKLTLKTRLASGVGEQTSTNQTFGSNGDQKAIWIDRAYLDWRPLDGVGLMAGKMANPLWTQYSSDAIWDADWNPEGAGENFSHLFGGVNLFANAMQGVLDEKSGATHNSAMDRYVFSEQVGLEAHLPLNSRIKIGYAYHDFNDYNINSSTFGVTVFGGSTSAEKSQEGNRKINGQTGKFGVQEISSEISSWIFSKPLSVQGTFLKNNRAGLPSNAPANLKPNDKKDVGYQVGAIYGKASNANTWEVAYFYKYLEADATVADLADSDFGDGGTNRRGHIAWIAYAPLEYLTFQAKYFQTKNIDGTLPGSLGSMDRVQVDMSVKF